MAVIIGVPPFRHYNRTSASLLVVRADTKIDSLIEAAKAKPLAVNYGSPGVGSPSHMAVVQLAALPAST
jgi:tripartite-type tricarboxylate transporter receptor subunit TctC